ncbi:MAG: SRPBCC family protein [Solirubrobacteraceae bacterium]
MRVASDITIGAPADLVWQTVADPSRYLDFMSGITRWEVVGERRQGMGARYRMLMRVGSAEIGGLVEIVEWSEARDLAWVSITGVDQRGRWRLRAATETRTRVELRLAYGVAGSGTFGWVAERLAAPTVRGHLRRTLQQLKRQVEHEQLRAGAAARRAA